MWLGIYITNNLCCMQPTIHLFIYDHKSKSLRGLGHILYMMKTRQLIIVIKCHVLTTIRWTQTTIYIKQHTSTSMPLCVRLLVDEFRLFSVFLLEYYYIINLTQNQ